MVSRGGKISGQKVQVLSLIRLVSWLNNCANNWLFQMIERKYWGGPLPSEPGCSTSGGQGKLHCACMSLTNIHLAHAMAQHQLLKRDELSVCWDHEGWGGACCLCSGVGVSGTF